ncbi:MAG: 16S rRNA (adenine(1518)-N(6)/adenine(1519)-N(6))-dimethyltransferase RsmA [Candidatus Paceibacterota bacterium]|jgi:16S rRNA (adenine1518-N6/adenine1519-N6)-dimethyltransferase
MLPKPKKRLGQHFLVNEEKLTTIARSLNPHEGDVVIEIGPGRGELTKEILLLLSSYKQKRLIVIEKDAELIPILKNSFSSFLTSQMFTIIEGDVREELSRVVASLQGAPYKLIGNIPYYLTGFLFRSISDLTPKPSLCVFTVQKEVALRASALPPHMNLFAASIQNWADTELIDTISKNNFSPPPLVDSAILRLTPHATHNTQKDFHFYSILKILFQQPRKTIINNLKVFLEASAFSLKEIAEFLAREGIKENDRPQMLSVSTIKKLASFLYTKGTI